MAAILDLSICIKKTYQPMLFRMHKPTVRFLHHMEKTK